MNKPLTMRELQKMSAAAIADLPHTVPIKSGRKTVGMLVPVRSGGSMDQERIDRIMRLGALADATRPPDVQRRVDEWLARNGGA